MERIRRATLDDLESLRKLWAANDFNTAELEKRLTEFQVAETEEGKFLGAIGFEMLSSQGLIHHEAFTEPTNTESLRALFWTRLQVLTSNHGVLRLWVRENSSNWIPFVFQPPTEEALKKLPEAWDRSATGWFTLQLKDENVIAKLDKEMAMFMTAERLRSEKIIASARMFKTIATIVGFLAAFLAIGAALWLFIARKTGGVTPPLH
ncbi:MAG TPA: hypothetical protein VH255_01045 [Verrucomicrobiae bacterium]|nr:hypothetical protein [Verrucomicrobiae bacterium]